MNAEEDRRGILYPARLPTFHRQTAPPELDWLVRWFWVPRWQLAPGRTSRQNLLPFPASNLVVEPQGVTLSGPTTGASHRDLTGTGWAVGALLRPAGVAALHDEPRAIQDLEIPFAAPDLHAAVFGAMADGDEDLARTRAIASYVTWIEERLHPPDENAALANAMEDLVASDPTIVRVEQLARALHVSVRGVQRLARRYIGLPPLAVIRRYRLQEAAQRLRDDPSIGLSRLAAELGYADHAHLTTDFRTVLGFTPSTYRREQSDRILDSPGGPVHSPNSDGRL